MKDEKLKEEYWKFLKKGLWIFGIGVLLMIVSPMIWTLRSGWIDFSNTGEIGDTIGGLTAPIIGIIGAALVFLSFMEQWKANRIQWEVIKETQKDKIQDQNFTILWNLFQEVRGEIRKPAITNDLLVLKKGVKVVKWENLIIRLTPIVDDLYTLLKTIRNTKPENINTEHIILLLHKISPIQEDITFIYEDIPNSLEDKQFIKNSYLQTYYLFYELVEEYIKP